MSKFFINEFVVMENEPLKDREKKTKILSKWYFSWFFDTQLAGNSELSVGQDTSNAAIGRVQALRAVVSRTSKPRWDTVSNTFLKSGEFQIFYHPP